MALSMLPQDPRSTAELLLLVAYLGAVMAALRCHRLIWVCYALAAFAYALLCLSGNHAPAASPAQEVPTRVCRGIILTVIPTNTLAGRYGPSLRSA